MIAVAGDANCPPALFASTSIPAPSPMPAIAAAAAARSRMSHGWAVNADPATAVTAA
jgi:hypothetical protein